MGHSITKGTGHPTRAKGEGTTRKGGGGMGQTGIRRDPQGQQKPWRSLEQDSDQSGCFPVSHLGSPGRRVLEGQRAGRGGPLRRQEATVTDLDPGQRGRSRGTGQDSRVSPRTQGGPDFRLSPDLAPKVTARPQQASGVPAEGRGQAQARWSPRAQCVLCPSRMTTPQEASRRRCAAGGPSSHDALTLRTACCHHFTGGDTEA